MDARWRHLPRRPWCLLLVALLAMTNAAAHPSQDPLAWGSYLPHIDVWEVTLAPGAEEARQMAFGDGVPLSSGWYVLVVADVEGDVRVRLTDDGPLAAWDWGSGHHQEGVRLQHDGYPTITVQNMGADNATARIYYDHTCDCLGKSVRLPEGSVVFPVPDGTWDFHFQVVPVRATFQTPEGDWDAPLKLRIVHLAVDATGDATILRSEEHRHEDGQDTCGIGRAAACVTAVARGGPDRVLMVEVSHGHPDWAVQVRPVMSEARDTSGPGLLLVLVLTMTACALRRHAPVPAHGA